MKDFFKRRVLPVFLTIALSMSVLTISAYADLGDALDILTPWLEDLWTMKTWREAVNAFFNGTASDDHGPYYASTAWGSTHNVLVEKSSLDDLLLRYTTDFESDSDFILVKSKFSDTSNYGLRIVNTASSGGTGRPAWLADSLGNAILAAETDPLAGAKWELRSVLNSRTKYLMSIEDLTNLAHDVGGEVFRSGSYWVILDAEHGSQVYVKADGRPFAAQYDEDKWAANQDRPSTTIKDENGNEITVEGDSNDVDLSLADGLLTVFGDVFNIDQLVYDEGTKTYYIDASTHNTTTNITNNYYFKWEYHVNYTSITYIGQTEEYDKYYEVYYELPDGRDSADLTKEELEQLNVSIDVIPYGRSADDTSLRSLYHFDGDTKDASYWNYCTDFTWNKGASLTYMDAGVFNGALYLDETEHDFTLTLPSGIGSHDFTLQFRYYQSATPAPQKDSYIQFGTRKFVYFNGSSILDSLSTELASVPVGTWNEFALMRSNGILYYYLNGICIGNIASTSSLSNQVTFHFGSSQQTFKYLDEIRILDFALQSGGSSYEPTSVPHDTNLSLVLPDSVAPVADEYWKLVTDGNLLPVSNYSVPFDIESSIYNSSGYQWTGLFGGTLNWTRLPYPDSTYVTVASYEGYSTFTNTDSGVYTPKHYQNSGKNYPGPASDYMGRAFHMYLGSYDPSVKKFTCDNGNLYPDGTEFSFSLMTSDGNLQSLSFVPYSQGSTCDILTAPLTGGGYLYIVSEKCYDPDGYGAYNWYACLAPPANGSVDVVYMEFKVGPANTGHEWVESVTLMDKDDLHTPTLAVRTDLEITSYQIGGVRPSIPTKGQVWALVENERIISIQIYNGQAWEGVDGRIWTGSRWIPVSSYNIVTLQDMYDIQDATPDYEYIYTEQGFWAWWQKSWNAFTEKLFSILQATDCNHVYNITAETEATCTDPGETTYTCSNCKHTYKDTVPALGHDWLVTEETPPTYELPADISCPDCGSLNFSPELDEDSKTYSCSCGDCSAVWTIQAVYTEGHTLYTCSRCGETTTELEEESDLFKSIGGLIADGITWVTDKMQELVQSISGITDIFKEFAASVKEKAGDYPAFLAAVVALMPEDLMLVVWFGVILFVVLAVWKKWFQ